MPSHSRDPLVPWSGAEPGGLSFSGGTRREGETILFLSPIPSQQLLLAVLLVPSVVSGLLLGACGCPPSSCDRCLFRPMLGRFATAGVAGSGPAPAATGADGHRARLLPRLASTSNSRNRAGLPNPFTTQTQLRGHLGVSHPQHSAPIVHNLTKNLQAAPTTRLLHHPHLRLPSYQGWARMGTWRSRRSDRPKTAASCQLQPARPRLGGERVPVFSRSPAPTATAKVGIR